MKKDGVFYDVLGGTVDLINIVRANILLGIGAGKHKYLVEQNGVIILDFAQSGLQVLFSREGSEYLIRQSCRIY